MLDVATVGEAVVVVIIAQAGLHDDVDVGLFGGFLVLGFLVLSHSREPTGVGQKCQADPYKNASEIAAKSSMMSGRRLFMYRARRKNTDM